MKDITAQEWKSLLATDNDAIIIDVRTDEEVSEGIIPGAKQIDIQNPTEFMQEIQQLDKNKNYYVYCKAGGRSAQACMVMRASGITTTYNLLGGFSQWDGDVEQL
ncbi:MAG TPA: rhodanese-like domain-containing protein [Flavobacteriaceae bacterium]|nr:rhodanese-like domain-containing protein [Flavobacteriaceae bacterium]